MGSKLTFKHKWLSVANTTTCPLQHGSQGMCPSLSPGSWGNSRVSNAARRVGARRGSRYVCSCSTRN